MAKSGFRRAMSSDEELLATGGNVRSEGKGRWVGGVLLVFGVTFAAAYYVPLHRTHSRLVAEYGALSERVAASEKELAGARAELLATSTKTDELSSKREAEDAAKRARAARMEKLGKELRSKVSAGIDKGELSLDARSDRVAVRLGASAVKTVRDHAEVAASAAGVLCDVAAAASSGSLRLTVVARAEGSAKSPWDSAAARAASVARVIAQKCGFPAERLSATARLAEGDGAGRVDLEIEPAEREQR